MLVNLPSTRKTSEILTNCILSFSNSCIDLPANKTSSCVRESPSLFKPHAFAPPSPQHDESYSLAIQKHSYTIYTAQDPLSLFSSKPKITSFARKKAMISPKRLINEMAKKRGVVSSTKADRGHFIVYSRDGRRFMVPLEYLNRDVFRELLRMSEDEFGIQGDGPIVLPYDSDFLDSVLSVLRRKNCRDEEKELFSSLLSRHYSSSNGSSLLFVGNCQQLVF